MFACCCTDDANGKAERVDVFTELVGNRPTDALAVAIPTNTRNANLGKVAVTVPESVRPGQSGLSNRDIDKPRSEPRVPHGAMSPPAAIFIDPPRALPEHPEEVAKVDSAPKSGGIFVVEIERLYDSNGSLVPLGLDLDFLDGECGIVNGIAPEGLIAGWNAKFPHKAVLLFDRIVCVNGEWGSSQLLMGEIKKGIDLVIKVYRPGEDIIVQVVKKKGQPLGVELNFVPSNNTLFIVKVNEGLIGAWNASIGKDHLVKCKDRITEVNGVCGGPSVLLDTIVAASDMLNFKISSHVPPSEMPLWA